MSEQSESRPKLGPTDRSLPIALLRARETVMGPVRDMLSRSQISEQKWRILRVLAEAGPMEQSAIAAQACLLLPSLTRLLKSMEEEALITRETGAQDKRKSIVSIAPAGLAIITEHACESRGLVTNLEQKFGKEDLDALLALLEKLRRTKL